MFRRIQDGSWEFYLSVASRDINYDYAFTSQAPLNKMPTCGWQILSPVAGFGTWYEFKFNAPIPEYSWVKRCPCLYLAETGVQLHVYKSGGH